MNDVKLHGPRTTDDSAGFLVRGRIPCCTALAGVGSDAGRGGVKCIMAGNAESQVQVGSVIAEKYLVEKILGQGGMGMVVTARHTGLRELRAIKFMLPHILRDRMAVERFRREAKAASRLRSEHVVRVHDIDRLENGALYIVMEHLEGQDLKAIANARGALPLVEACGYVLQACDAIAEAHAAGIVHRDLKLANLFLTTGRRGEPQIKVLDFGIAKLANRTGSVQPELTETNLALGSPAFMAPEQMRSSRQSDARTDIWALGVILYKLTTGVLPFEAPSIPEIALRILSDEHVRKPSVHNRALPTQFDQIVQKCLEKDRDRRFGSVTELSNSLRALVEQKDAETSDDLTLELPTQALAAVRGERWPFGIPPRLGAAARAYSPAELAAGAPAPSASKQSTTFVTPPERLARHDMGDTTTPPLPNRAHQDALSEPAPSIAPPTRRRPRLASAPTMPDIRIALIRRGIAPLIEDTDAPPHAAPPDSSIAAAGLRRASSTAAGGATKQTPERISASSFRTLAVSGLVGVVVGAVGLWLALSVGACASSSGAASLFAQRNRSSSSTLP